MRKTIIFAAIAAAAAIFATSCQEVIDIQNDGVVKVTLSASSAQSKVSFGTKDAGVYPVTWDATGESVKMIEVANGTYNTYASSAYSASVDGASASFSFDITPVAASTYDYYFLSPSGSFNYTFPDYCSLGIALNQNQACRAASVDPATAILFSSKTALTEQGGSMSTTFSHLTAYGKLAISNLTVGDGEVVQNVTFKSEGKVITGLNAYVWNTDSYVPVVGYVNDNVIISTTNVDTSTGAFDVWFSCWPFDLAANDKFSVVVTTDKAKYGRTITMPSANSFTAGHVAEIGVNMTAAEKSSAVSELYMLGDACATGWNLNAMQPFSNIDGVFNWEGSLTAAGEFRFPVQKIGGVWWPCLVIDVANNCVVYDSDSAKYCAMGSQYHVPADGLYQVVVDTRDFYNMSYSVTAVAYPVNTMCITGDATPSMWSPASYPMTRISPNVFSWTGDLNAGSVRFSTVSNFWPSIMISGGAGVYVADEATYYANPSAYQHYSVPAAGNYTITVDLSNRSNVSVNITAN